MGLSEGQITMYKPMKERMITQKNNEIIPSILTGDKYKQ